MEQGRASDMVLGEVLILVNNDGQIPWLLLVTSYQGVSVWRLVLPVTIQEVGGSVQAIVSKNQVNSEGHRLVRNMLAISERVVISGELYTDSKVMTCSQSSEISYPPKDMFPVREGGVGKGKFKVLISYSLIH